MNRSNKKIVCPRCHGEGAVVNPEVDGNGISSQEFRDDPDFAEDYFSRVYDITCPHCQGKNVTTRKEYHAWLREESERRQDRLTSLQEMGIYPGHRDYF